MQGRPEFSFPGSPARVLPPRPPANPMAPRYGEEEVRWLQASLQASPDYSSGDSGTPSPQLWAAHHHPELQLHHRPYPASAGSSPSRAQAIAGYRREMLDLVRGLPESAYELSLRDIVERPSPAPYPPPDATTARRHTDAAAAAAASGSDEPAGGNTTDAVADDGRAATQGGSKGKRQGRKQRTMRKQRSRSLERSVSLDTGLLIKLFLPLSIGGKKKVSPKPEAAKDGKKKKQGKKKEAAPAPAQEEEWWTKSEFSEAGGSSRTSSTGSSNSSAASIRNVNGGGNPRAPTRSGSRKRTGCYAFFRANKGKTGVNQN